MLEHCILVVITVGQLNTVFGCAETLCCLLLVVVYSGVYLSLLVGEM